MHRLSLTNARRLRYGIVVLSLGLTVAACGGDDAGSAGNESADFVDTAATGDSTAGDSTTDAAASDQSTSPSGSGGIEVPEFMPTADGLIPELAGLPVPDGAVFGVGDAYDADADPRQTAVQPIFFSIPVEEVVAFYLDELPAAGYTIESGMGGLTDKSEIVPGQQALIRFSDPAGLPGQVLIGPGSFAASQLNVNVFRSGVR